MISNDYEVRLGVPQGSVLGPLIFLPFVNELSSFISEGNITMFADDNSFGISAPNAAELFDKTIAVMREFDDYCNNNNLILNVNKTVCVYFSQRKSLPVNILNFNDIIIPFSQSVKFLDVLIDSKLSWDIQIDEVCKKT
ncbi:hypothetical protein NQ314_007306 [Rhamnusium bicolor]|uniref:Reverse transcriptase domain-containing protein n=1 Tax=Rhamnusium bicolor TaxID=1586634 RepID=A0AAV8YPQ9_9CUCU|nr:hypothetical protein NQ314_007306 [Rhamnusium bicolor]